MAKRPCLTCGQLTAATRCPACTSTRRNTRYGGNWRKISQQVRQAQPWCSWCGATDDLCADHIVPGQAQFGVRTLCRPCNTKRRNGAREPGGGSVF